jgi:hypothetical protein
LESDAFVPSVGLVRRTSATIAGPLVLCLIYARVGETTVLSQPEVTFGLSLDRSVYSPHLTVPELMVKITLRVRQGLPLELTFPSAQRFELTIRNADGKEVYRWSDGMAFAQMVGTERFGPAEKNWLVRVPLRSRDGNQFPPGKYTAASWLTSIGEPRYAASVGFEIAPWREPVTGLAGNWIFEARTSDGLLRARLALEEDGEKLSATLRIDNHVLKGEGKSDGTQFEVKL